jgi:hypothetical protein
MVFVRYWLSWIRTPAKSGIINQAGDNKKCFAFPVSHFFLESKKKVAESATFLTTSY